MEMSARHSEICRWHPTVPPFSVIYFYHCSSFDTHIALDNGGKRIHVMWLQSLVINCIVKTEPERCNLSGMMLTRLELSNQWQVQPECRGGFGGWLWQTQKIEEREDEWVGWVSCGTEGLSHCEEGSLGGVSSPDTSPEATGLNADSSRATEGFIQLFWYMSRLGTPQFL